MAHASVIFRFLFGCNSRNLLYYCWQPTNKKKSKSGLSARFYHSLVAHLGNNELASIKENVNFIAQSLVCFRDRVYQTEETTALQGSLKKERGIEYTHEIRSVQ